jgi:hypothetical protein
VSRFKLALTSSIYRQDRPTLKLGLPQVVHVRRPIDYLDVAIDEKVEPMIRLKQEHE